MDSLAWANTVSIGTLITDYMGTRASEYRISTVHSYRVEEECVEWSRIIVRLVIALHCTGW